jgi:hypothetical protein
VIETHGRRLGRRSRRRSALIASDLGPLKARGVALMPAFGDREEREVVKAYRLHLACELPGGGIDLIFPLAVPGKGEPRTAFLEELTRLRALGRQVATLFKVLYLERTGQDARDGKPVLPPRAFYPPAATGT